MAIIGPRPEFIPVDDAIRGLEAARSGALLVHAGQSICSASAIAPGLAIAPGYALGAADVGPGSPLTLRLPGSGGQLPAVEVVADGTPEVLGTANEEELVRGAPSSAGFSLLAVIAFEPDQRIRPLELSFEACGPGQAVFVLGYPSGRGPTLTLGRVRACNARTVDYDADTEPGSGGSMVLDASFKLVAMHMHATFGKAVNTGLSRAFLLELLKQSRHWPRVADHHRLYDTAAAVERVKASVARSPPPEPQKRDGPPEVAIRAAFRAGIDPAELSETDREALRPLVVDPSAWRWVLRLAERRRILRGLGGLEQLRASRPAVASPEPIDAVVERILAGPPYALGDLEEALLPLWISAVHWFEGLVPDLPSAAQIADALERRRLRSRLHELAGAPFRGRDEELALLRSWYARRGRPLSVNGIGGVGKSALVAQFASSLPEQTLLLWLDFDRPDLAPDDADSLLVEISRQATLQLPGFEAPSAVPGADWRLAARRLAEALAAALAGAPPSLLVLDSFEAAQYAERYQELWPVLGLLRDHVSDLRILVTGRAPVARSSAGGWDVESLPLGGLKPDESRRWLQGRGVRDEALIERIVVASRGIPLVIRLAECLIERGGSMDSVPDALSAEMISGYLYDRILDRVQDPDLKPVARGVLPLRRLTPEMMRPILDGIVDLPASDPREWFAGLARELALVEGKEVLRVRPEVRSATLRLLEQEDATFVRRIDERAARWYATQDLADPELAAELVYHSLRLGDIPGATRAWRRGCDAFLTLAPEDLDGEARTWLSARVGALTDAPVPVTVWEEAALERIQDTRARGLERIVPGILGERAERSAASPLVFQEAFQQYLGENDDEALRILNAAGSAPGYVGRDRAVLRAAILVRSGAVRWADSDLASFQEPGSWKDRPDAEVFALLVQAARVRLTIDLVAEAQLVEFGDQMRQVEAVLSPADVVGPRAQHWVARLEPSMVQYDVRQKQSLRKLMEHVQSRLLPAEPPGVRAARYVAWRDWPHMPWAAVPVARELLGVGDPLAHLLELSWRRTWLLDSTTFLRDAYAFAAGLRTSPLKRFAASVVATFAPLASQGYGSIVVTGEAGPAPDLLPQSRVLKAIVPHKIPHQQKARRVLLSHAVERSVPSAAERAKTPLQQKVRGRVGAALETFGLNVFAGTVLERWFADSPQAGAIAVFVYAPDPLELLVHDLAGADPGQSLEAP